MAIQELVRTDVVTAPPDASARNVATLMEEKDVGSVLIVEDNRPVGIVTDRDLTLEVVSRGSDATELSVSDVMTTNPFTVDQDEGIYEVLAQVSQEGVRRIPVTGEDGTLVGIVTLDDFVVLLAGEMQNVSDVIQAESPPY